ncbi:MAG TPA: methylmalonyl Co-A mutase-associated GTPase MeaB [bacterium]|nr:methylmalonyl Co-A mutase-associated GTPase MeaB [bacterium]
MTVTLLDDALAGSHQALGRLISLVEDGTPEGRALLARLHGRTGAAHIVGVTGAPGVGKSTLVDALIRTLRGQGRTVAVVAVDPTSPFTGGALLGDRIRMQDHASDPGVFIRSMATRGSLGGLAPATADVVRVLDAVGYQVIFIETVGTGQAEVDVVGAADTVVIVLVPGMGDAVQTMKAGIMEIGEIFVVNKADQGDAHRTVTEVQMMLAQSARRGGWTVPVLPTVATVGEGVAAVAAAVAEHRRWLESSGVLAERRRARARAEILRLVERRVRERVLAAGRDGLLEMLVERVLGGGLDPDAAAEELVGRL